jgi:hypothetical protein
MVTGGPPAGWDRSAGLSPRVLGAAGDDLGDDLGDLGLGPAHGALGGGDGHDDRVEAAREVRPAGGGVVVGGVVERLDRGADGGGQVGLDAVALLQRAAGEHRARADGVVAGGLAVQVPGDVVGEDPPGGALVVRLGVVADQQRHDREPLHGRAEVAADHRGELVGLALQREGGALDLLVVLQLHGEQPQHLHAQPGRAGHPGAE